MRSAVAVQDRNATLAELAHQAAGLANVERESPKVALWKEKAREFVEAEFGAKYLKILNSILRFDRVITSESQGQHMHHASMQRAAVLLRELMGKEQTVSKPKPAPSGQFLSMHDLHPAVQEACVKLYEAGHLAEAVEKSFRVVRGRLRELTTHETGAEAFGKGKLRVDGAIASWVEDDFNEAVKFLTMAIDRFRNEKAHTTDANLDPVKAAEYIAMSSLAMRLLDNAHVAS